MASSVELPYRIVDVFSDRPLGGNALCVVGEPAPDVVMQAIAREVNLSETAFVTPTGDRRYDVRIFTPAAELPFAGHPTLGAAWTMGTGSWKQRSPGGTVDVEVTEAGASMRHPAPVLTEVYPEDAAKGLGLPAGSVRRGWVAEVLGTRHLLVATDRDLTALRFDGAILLAAARAVRATGVAALRAIDHTTVQVRLFVPGPVTAFEDPGTGSAAAAVAAVARRVWGTGADITVCQGDEIGRPCRIEVALDGDDAHVGGAVAPCAQGVFTLGPL